MRQSMHAHGDAVAVASPAWRKRTGSAALSIAVVALVSFSACAQEEAKSAASPTKAPPASPPKGAEKGTGTGTGTAKGADKTFAPEEIEQILAPIALYPDDVLSQIFMASTYPLEVVEAARWVKANPKLQGDKLTAELEKKTWDPSVKSLVNLPQVLSMMDEKLDWTQKLGDAFLSQQKEVMDSVQTLRKKAKDSGNLETTKEQKVIVEEQIIRIEAASPQVIYVPTYNPTVVYGAWPYPAYPPYYYYPPGYTAAATVMSFGVGLAVGAAWGYAWGGCDWHHSDVHIDVDRNVNVNQNINRESYKARTTNAAGTNAAGTNAAGRGSWQHDPQHRKGVAYNDQKTAQKYGKNSSDPRAASRDAYRGRADSGRPSVGTAGGTGATDRSRAGTSSNRSATRPSTSTRDSAFGGVGSGSDTRRQSARGSQSRASSQPSSGSRSRPTSRPAGGGARGGGGRRR